MEFNHSIFEYFLYASGFTDKSFAQRLGCTRQIVYLWRTGGSKPPEKDLSKIAKTLEIDPSVLKMSDSDFSEMVQDPTHSQLRQRLIREKLFANFFEAIDGDSLEEWRHALRVAVFLNEVS